MIGGVVLPEEGAHDVTVVEADVREPVALGAHDASLAHVEHLHTRFTTVAGQPEDVAVCRALVHDLLALDGALHRLHLVAQARRLLVAFVGRRALHAPSQVGDELFGAAAQEERRALHHRRVARFLHQPAAGARAALHLVLDAGPATPGVVAEDGVAAGAQGEDPPQVGDGVAHGHARRVGPEVERAVLLETAHLGEPRPRLPGVEPQHQILLVVAQANVERRLVPLDELVLQQQRVLDVRRHHHVDVPRAFEQQRDADASVAAAHVAAYAAAEVLGLADVQDLARLAAEQVDAGSGREGLGSFGEGHVSRPAGAPPRAHAPGRAAPPRARTRAARRPRASRGANCR